MSQQPMPFRFMDIPGDSIELFQPGDVISTLNECGIFICTGGMVEVALDNEHYHIYPGDIYIYMPSALVRLIRKSTDATGILVAVDINFALPVAQRVVDTENLLYLRKHPCITLVEDEFMYLRGQIKNWRRRVNQEDEANMGFQRQRLHQELVKSMGQTIIYEILNVYFTHQPIQPLSQNKKDVIFHNFLLALFRHFRKEREVAFYADLQHLTPRYFSAIIKEKSGSNPLQWIMQMVITEAKLLLETSNLSVKEIAMQLNFPTQSFFGKYFKQYVGVSPKDYRNMVHGEHVSDEK